MINTTRTKHRLIHHREVTLIYIIRNWNSIVAILNHLFYKRMIFCYLSYLTCCFIDDIQS